MRIIIKVCAPGWFGKFEIKNTLQAHNPETQETDLLGFLRSYNRRYCAFFCFVVCVDRIYKMRGDKSVW